MKINLVYLFIKKLLYIYSALFPCQPTKEVGW